MKKAIKFLMPHTVGALYSEGEIAGFAEPVANDLIKRGIAEPVDGKGAAKGGKGKSDAKADKAAAEAAAALKAATAELEAKSEEELAKAIEEEKVKVAADADTATKIKAILTARKGK